MSFAQKSFVCCDSPLAVRWKQLLTWPAAVCLKRHLVLPLSAARDRFRLSWAGMGMVLAEPLSWHAAGKPRFSITGEWDKDDDLGAAIDQYQVLLEKQTARSVQV